MAMQLTYSEYKQNITVRFAVYIWGSHEITDTLLKFKEALKVYYKFKFILPRRFI
jgi:hypothetical protein